jgi:hypothetical protein
MQNQHVPGYQGHVPLLNSENIFAKTFAKATSDCMNDKIQPGFIIGEKERFNTTYGQFYESQNPAIRKDVLKGAAESMLSNIKKYEVEKQMTTKATSISDVPPIDRLPVIGYQGYRPVYMNPVKQAQMIPPPDSTSINTKLLSTVSELYRDTVLQNSDEMKREVTLFVPVLLISAVV